MCQTELRKRTRTAGTGEGYALTRKVVAHHGAANDAWVVYKGGVYDVTLFLESHPGGADVMLGRLGGDVTELMEGAGDGHTHSKFAYKILERYRIGELVGGAGAGDGVDGNIDPVTGEELVKWGKPILHQVGMLGDKYDQWIHSFPTTDHTVKMFTNDTLESLTKCPWYVPLLFWIPVLLVEFAHYVHLIGGLAEIQLGKAVVSATCGGLFWLLFEYTLHRFVFHVATSGYYSNIFHFLVHGHHHITPMDFDRLVFPPIPAVLLASPFWYFAPRMLGVQAGYPWLIGFALGYLVYDMTHFWIHHGVPTSSFLKMQKRRHVHHHYFQHTVNFGISNPLFDVVFSTLKQPTQ